MSVVSLSRPEQSLALTAKQISGLETFTLGASMPELEDTLPGIKDTFFNPPDGDDDDEDWIPSLDDILTE
jgi:hypothetical protein